MMKIVRTLSIGLCGVGFGQASLSIAAAGDIGLFDGRHAHTIFQPTTNILVPALVAIGMMCWFVACRLRPQPGLVLVRSRRHFYNRRHGF